MDGKISKDGILYIRRGDKLKKQFCQFCAGDTCGDLCPQFGEPVHVCNNETNAWTFDICQGKHLTFENFTDERMEK